jgi:predicted TIM-barrel fold metal-dependent hydrolase
LASAPDVAHGQELQSPARGNPVAEKTPQPAYRDHVYLTTQPIEEPEKPAQLLQSLEMIDAPRNILFSSDYPHWDFDHPPMALTGLPAAGKDRIFHQNAADLYGLGPWAA